MLKKIKIATFIPTLETGGAEKLAIDLVSELDRNIFEVILIVLFPKKGSLYETIALDRGITVKYLNKSPGLDISTFFEVWSTLQQFKPDVVHTHIYTTTYVWPWMICHKNTKWVHTVHSVASKELYSFHKPLMTTVYNNYKKFIPVAISNSIKQSIIDEYKVEEGQISLINNGIDIKLFTQSKLDNKIDSNYIEFICVARFNEVKNHKLLLTSFGELLKRIPKSRLTLVGDGELRSELENIILELDIANSVKIVGETNNVRDYLNKADIFLLTSKYEGLPLSILESMAAGLPIIATEVGGVPDIVKNELNGILVESENINALTSAMIRMANDSPFRKKISSQNEKDVKNYDISNIAKKYEELFLISSPKNRIED